MKRLIRVLAIVVVVQLVLVAGAYVGSGNLETSTSGAALLTFKAGDVDGIVIEGGNKAVIKLVRHDGWQTASGFPADGHRIGTLLQRLQDLKHGLAVATTPSALSRFKVAKENFERHLILRKGDREVAELYLGNGAGARQSYARGAQDQAIYAVHLGSYELPLKEHEWQDKTLLQLRSSEVTAIEMQAVKLTRTIALDQEQPASWMSDQIPAGKRLDQGAITRVLDMLQSLRFSKVLGTQVPAGFYIVHPALSFNVTYQGKQRQYRFVKQSKGDDYTLKVSSRPEYFQVDGYTVKALLKQMKPAVWFVDPAVKHQSPDQQTATKKAGRP